MSAIAPTVHEDPRDGLGAETSDYYCMKCVEWGVCSNMEDTYPNPPEENTKRVIPCTICAMANGGRWAWKEGHKGDINYTLKSNGYFPGCSGIEDVLTGHSTEPTVWWSVTDEETVQVIVKKKFQQQDKNPTKVVTAKGLGNISLKHILNLVMLFISLQKYWKR